jgi:hypothetical protein
MMDYRAAIESLDERTGHVHTLVDVTHIGKKAPELVSDNDLIVIGFFHGEKHANEARARRDAALAPPVTPSASTDDEDREAFDAAFTRRFSKSLSAEDRALLSEHVAEWQLHEVRLFLKDMNEKNVLRNQRLAALEQRNQELEARILELETQRAAVLR